MLVLVWAALAVLRLTMWREWMGFALGVIQLFYWAADAFLFNHLGPSTFAGIYLAPVAAFQFGSRRMGRIFGVLSLVLIVFLWRAGAQEPSLLAPIEVGVVLMDRIGLLALMLSFTIVLIYERLFLNRMLDQTYGEHGMAPFDFDDRSAEREVEGEVDLGETLARVAHDLSNPLMYALANVEWIVEGSEQDGDPLQFMEDAHEGLARVAATLRNLEGPRHVKLPVDIAAVIDAAVRSTRSSLEGGVQIEVETPSASVSVVGDDARLVRVLVNLLANAAQATARGKRPNSRIRVYVELTPSRVNLVVSDTGHGIPAAILERVQQPFFTTRGAEEGTGLGLAICSQIAHEHRGTLRLESQVDVGTKAILSLPRLAERTVTPSPRVEQIRASGEGSALNVLIIDDDLGMLRLVQRALTQMNVTVLQDSRRALELCEAQTFDVIVCDIMMPNSGGPEVYESVCRELPQLADRFLFLTGDAFSSAAAAFVDAMADRVMRKPMRMRELRERIFRTAVWADERLAASDERVKP